MLWPSQNIWTLPAISCMLAVGTFFFLSNDCNLFLTVKNRENGSALMSKKGSEIDFSRLDEVTQS